MPKRWVTGCPHFGHANIVHLCNRPFANVHEMNKTLTDNWNQAVHPEDTVYVLGDLSFKAPRPAWQYTDQLNGKIILVWGNHDRHRKDLVKHGIEVHDYLELEVDDRLVVLNHYPIEEWNGWFNGSIHLHAHCHGNRPNAVRRYDVGVDTNNFQPLDLEYVVRRLKTNQVFEHGTI